MGLDTFCGSDFTGSWIVAGDLHPCVQSILLNDLPPGIFLFFGLYQIITIYRRQVQIQWNEIAPRLPIVISLLLSLIAFASFVKYLATSPRIPYQLTQSLLTMLGWVTATILLVMERRRVLILHASIRIFWVLDSLTLLKSVESSISSLAHGNALDDTMLLYFLRLPLELVMTYYSVTWRKRGLDEDAIMQRVAEDEANVQGGNILHLNSPQTRRYALVDSLVHEEDYDIEQPRATRNGNTNGESIWGRFLKFATSNKTNGHGHISSADSPSQRNRALTIDDPNNMHMGGVHHVDTGSFIRPPSFPLPQSQAAASPASPSTTRSNPTSHPLYQCSCQIPSFNEQQIHNRSLVQYCMKVRIMSPRFASGDEALDTITVWKKYTEFEGLHDLLLQTSSKFSLTTLPKLPPPPARAPYANYEHTRLSLEIYIQQVMIDPSYWDDIGGFVNLREKIHHMMKGVLASPNQIPIRKPGSAASSPPPLSSSFSSGSFGAGTKRNSYSQFGSTGGGPDWSIIGVSVTAWMRWTTTDASSPASKSRRASLNDSLSSTPLQREESGGSGKPITYVTFQVRVRTTRGEWNVHKKVNEVQALRTELIKKFPTFPVPNLSLEKNWEKDELTLAQARRTVEIFLQSVASTSYFECLPLFMFLAEEEHHTKRVTKDTMTACSDPALMPTPVEMLPSTNLGATSESVPMPVVGSASGTKRSRARERDQSSSLVASSMGAGMTQPSLGRSLSGAEASYFSTSLGGANTGSSSGASASSPTSGLSSSVNRSPPPFGTSATTKAQRHSLSVSGVHHHATSMAGSYLDGEDEYVSSDSVESDEELSEHEKGNGLKGEQFTETMKNNGVLPSDASSGQLPVYQMSVKRPDGNHRFTVNITKWSFVAEASDENSVSDDSKKAKKKSSSKKHVSFHILIREFFELDSYLEWSVDRRYAQFDALHKSLKSMFNNVDFPPLPPKTLSKKPSMAFLDNRLIQLEIYLQKLINTTHFQVDEFFSFFDMNNANRQITMGSLKDKKIDEE